MLNKKRIPSPLQPAQEKVLPSLLDISCCCFLFFQLSAESFTLSLPFFFLHLKNPLLTEYQLCAKHDFKTNWIGGTIRQHIGRELEKKCRKQKRNPTTHRWSRDTHLPNTLSISLVPISQMPLCLQDRLFVLEKHLLGRNTGTIRAGVLESKNEWPVFRGNNSFRSFAINDQQQLCGAKDLHYHCPSHWKHSISYFYICIC